MSSERIVLLLGRRDEPTDGVADYCEHLREAGTSRGLSFELVRVPWAEKGWPAALAELLDAATSWRRQWVVLQYTTLAWSRRGFPLRAPHVVEVVRRSGARPGVVLHDFAPPAQRGVVGRAREYCHLRVLSQLYSRSDIVIFTVPVNKVGWLPLRREKAVFIPVGANCPEAAAPFRSKASEVKTVAVYSVTGGQHRAVEVADLGFALRRASQSAGGIRLLLFGRGSEDALPALRAELTGAPVEIKSFGLLPPAEVSRVLSRADVLLFVRGQISSRRGSALAGIACGLPVVCYSGPETTWPVTEAGILGVPLLDREALACALDRVLIDDELREKLAERSHLAQQKYFSWNAITEQFAAALGVDQRKEADELLKQLSLRAHPRSPRI